MERELPASLNPPKPHLFLLFPTRFPPPPTSPSRIKCGEICARDAVGRRSLLPLSFGPGSAWCWISPVVQVSSCLWTGARGSGFRAWLGFSFFFSIFLLLDQFEYWDSCLCSVQCYPSGSSVLLELVIVLLDPPKKIGFLVAWIRGSHFSISEHF